MGSLVTRWLGALVALVFLYQVRAILGPFLIATLLAYVLVPGVDHLANRLKVRRGIVVGALYLLLVGGLIAFFISIRPTLSGELAELRKDSTGVVERAITQLIGGETLDLFGTEIRANALAAEVVNRFRQLTDTPTGALQFASAALTRAGEFVLTLIVLFYLLLDWEQLVKLFFRFVPAQERARVSEITARIHQILGQYIRGQLILIAFIAIVTWIFLQFVFHLPFALVLAIATGFLEVLPLVGPIVAASIAAIVAVSRDGPQVALYVILFYTALRQTEDWFIAPNILGHAVKLHPGVALFAVIAGGTLAGPLGLLLGVPAAAAAKVILDVSQPPLSESTLIVPEGKD